MKKQILAAATALALAAGLTTGAIASDHRASRHDRHIARIHADGTHSARPRHGNSLASQGGWEGGNPYGSGYRDLGPLGVTFGCVHGYCGQGYSVDAWSR
jgi:hypothetical protein